MTTRRGVLRDLVGLGLLACGARAVRAQGALEGVIGIDMHSHAAGVHYASRPLYFLAEQMKRGGVSAACLCHTGDGPVLSRNADGSIAARDPAPGELYRHHLERLRFLDAMFSDQGFRRMLKPGDLQAAHKEGVAAVIQGIEGTQFLDGKLERVAEAHQRGVRHLQLVHFLRSELGDNQTEPASQGGLTAFGREVIQECNRLGMVVDVAHGTMRFVEQAAKVSRTPLVLSHVPGLRAKPGLLSRSITPQHAKLVAQTGGVIGIWTLVGAFKSLDDWADGVARAVEAVGADHVGFASDMGGAPKNLFTDYSSFPAMLERLRARGLSAADVAKIAGANYVRVFDRSVESR